jgi:hypothetical protein
MRDKRGARGPAWARGPFGVPNGILDQTCGTTNSDLDGLNECVTHFVRNSFGVSGNSRELVCGNEKTYYGA